MITYTGLDGTTYVVPGTKRRFKDAKPGDLFTYGANEDPGAPLWMKLNDDPNNNCQLQERGKPFGLVYPNDYCRFVI